MNKCLLCGNVNIYLNSATVTLRCFFSFFILKVPLMRREAKTFLSNNFG